MRPTPPRDLDLALRDLRRGAERWGALDARGRAQILKRLRRDTIAAAPAWVRTACELKGLGANETRSAEEWLAGPAVTLRHLRLLQRSMAQIAEMGSPRLFEDAVRRLANGQVAVKVLPQDGWDRVLFAGFRGEVHMVPDLDPSGLPAAMAHAYRQPTTTGVALVLGAGNVSSIGPMDVLHKLFVDNRVCILKMHPVNEALGPHLESSFRGLVEPGCLRIVYGGAETGEYLVDHEAVDEVHITGSDRVHDLIVWGPDGPESEETRRQRAPRLTKPITSELGCVTPLIVVPGDWTEREMAFQTQNVATMVVNNASYNCNSARILVTSSRWHQRDAFLRKLGEVLAAIPLRQAYYPGSREKFERILAEHPEARKLGRPSGDQLPWTLIEGIDCTQRDEMAFRLESWSPILAESPLPGDDAPSFLARAVDFCNERLWGTLCCGLLVDPRTHRALEAEVEEAIVRLRYGSVVINHWPALSYGFVVTPWGAHPGHSLADIQSGIGFVHNTLMFEAAQKAVIRGPFTLRPRPPWFATHRRAHQVARKLAYFEARPSLAKLPGIALSALRG